MKEVAYIRSSSFYDDSRATKEVKALSEAGYMVHIIGWDRNGIAENECAKIFNKNVHFSFYNKQVKGGIGYKGIFKLIGFVSFVRKQLEDSKHNLFAVHACDLDGGIGAYRFCKRTRVPLVYDIYDYYIDSHNISGTLSWIVERQEIKLINLATATIICTEERRSQINKANPKRVIVVHNSPEVEKSTNVDSKYDYAYCGVLSDGRLLQEILDGYKDNSDLSIIVAGSGRYESYMKAANDCYPNFCYAGPVSYDKVLSIESNSSIISAIYNPNKRNHVLCAPNKFYEALGLGKPIIVCKGTGIDKLVEKEKLGMVIDYNADSFYEALRYLLSNPVECLKMGSRGRQLYEKRFRWTLMNKRIVQLYKDITN